MVVVLMLLMELFHNNNKHFAGMQMPKEKEKGKA